MAQVIRIEVEVTANDRTASSGISQLDGKIDTFCAKMSKAETQLNKLTGSRKQVMLELKDRLTSAARTAWNVAKNLCSKAIHATVKLKDMITAPLRNIWRNVINPMTMALSTLGVGVGLVDTINTYKDFETTMSKVRAITGATSGEFALLQQQAISLGGSTVFSAKEVAEGMTYLGMAGWKNQAILDAMPGLLSMAAASATDLATASDILSDVMSAFGMEAKEAGVAADVFAQAATSSNTTVQGIGDSMKYAAPVAKTFGMDLQETAAVIAIFANAGIKGQRGGTSLRAALLNMAKPTEAATKLMDKLGVSFTKSDGDMRSIKDIVGNLNTAFQGLSRSEKLAATQTLFGTSAASAMLALIDEGPVALDKYTQAMYDSAGAADKMAATMNDNLAGDIEQFAGAVESAQIALMTGDNADSLRKAIQWLTAQVPAAYDAITGFATSAINKFIEVKNAVTGLFNSDEFKNADGLWGKLTVAWDKLVVEPFDKWWKGGGSTEVDRIATQMGKDMGETMSGLILAGLSLLTGEEVDIDGLNLSPMAKAGMKAGSAFLESFGEAFDVESILEKIPTAIQNVLEEAAKVLPGGEDPTALSWLAAGGTVAAGAKIATFFSDLGLSVGTLKGMLEGCGTAIKAFATLPGPVKAAAAVILLAVAATNLYYTALENQRQSILHMGEEVDAAITNVNETMQRAQEIKDLIAQRDEAVSKIELGGLSAEDTQTYLDRIKSINEALMELSGGLITQYDLENGAIESKLELLQQQLEIERQIALMKLQNQVDENRGKMPELQKQLYEGYQKNGQQHQGLEYEWQSLYASSSAVSGLMGEVDYLRAQQALESQRYSTAIQQYQDGVKTYEEIEPIINGHNGRYQQLIDGYTDESGVYHRGYHELGGALESVAPDNAAVWWLQGMETSFMDGSMSTDEHVPGIIAEMKAQIAQNETEFARVNEERKAAWETVRSQMQGEKTLLEGQYLGGVTAEEFAKTYGEHSTEEQHAFGEFITALQEVQGSDDYAWIPKEYMTDTTSLMNSAIKNGKNAAPTGKYDFSYIGTELNTNQLQYMSAIDTFKTLQSSFEAYNDAVASGNKELTQQLAQGIIDNSGGYLSNADMVQGQLRDDRYTAYQQDVWATAGNAESQWSTYLQNLPQIAQQLATAYAQAGTELQALTTKHQEYGDAVTAITELQTRANQAEIDQYSTNSEVASKAKDDIAAIMDEYAALAEANPDLKLPDISSITELQTALAAATTARDEIAGQVNDLTASMASISTIKTTIDSINAQGASAFTGHIAKAQQLNNTINAIPTSRTTIWTIKINTVGSPPKGSGLSIPGNAEGGIYDGAMLSLVAEDGPEAIIPLGSKRRERGMALWREAGKALGVTEFADGGLVGVVQDVASDNARAPEGAEGSPSLVTRLNNDSPIAVQITVQPTIRIEGAGGDAAEKLQEKMPELADQLCGLVAVGMKEIFENRAS